MPRRRTTSAARRRRAIAAAIGGLAIGIAGVGAALPAAAAPERGSGDAPPPAPVIAGAPTGEHRVTLITGDRVTVTDLADGTHAVSVETAVPGAGYQTVTAHGELSIIPAAAERFLAAGVVDPDLFNVTRLIEYGYDDASVDATPVIVELDQGPAPFSAEPPVPGLAVGTPLESIGAAAATAGHADAASTWAALTGTDAAADAGPRSFGADFDDASLGGGIAAIHLDGKVRATLDSSVPWVGAPEAWAEGYTGTGVTVAVLDTGYDDTHPDLAGRVLPDSTSFVPGEEVAWDPNGHGTHVASTIAGTGAASGGGHRGVADGASLLVGKVLDQSGYGQDSWIIDAMEWAAERAPIVSMSLGSMQASDGDDLMADALDGIAEQTGALFVVAAGNNGAPETIGSPGSAEHALTVGSVDDPSGALSWFSSQGPLVRSGAMKPEIAGPGNEVTAARSADYAGGDGSYLTMSGTSMATPHVAGGAAIVKQQHPEYTADQLRAALLSTATDVGLTSYQAGAGVLDVGEAVDAPVVASGSGDFGMLVWGEEPAPVVRTIEYANRGDAEVVLDLAAALADTTPGGGDVDPMSADAASDVLVLDIETVTIPAGETRTVMLTADPAKVPAGAQLSGALVASIDGEAVARTALGIIAEPERYDLTITATGFDGEPVEAYAVLYDHDAQQYGLVGVAGETTLRLLAGRYSVMSVLELDREADTVAQVLVGDPDLVLDGAASVALDARAAKPVTVDVGEDGLAATVRRMDVSADGYGNGVFAPVWTDELWAQPMDAPNVEHFDFTARWRLQEAPLALEAGKERLDLIPQAGSIRLDGSLKTGAVDVGTGSVDEFAAVDVRGAVAIATRSDAVSPRERAANALAAGAAMLLVANDADGELSEWVGADDGTEVGIPVAAMSGVQGRQVLDVLASKGRLTISGEGVANADEIWDLARYDEGSIPEDLDYRPTDLARIDTTYHGDEGDLVGEFRWDFAPNAKYGFGLPMGMGRGIERTEWVNTDVGWYQDATVVEVGWQVRDVLRTYEPGEHVETSYFGPIVRPFVGPGYWAPHRTGDFLQVNLPSWADGGEPEHTGTFDVFAGYPGFSQTTDLYLNGEYVKSSPFQGVNVFGLPDGDAEVRVVNTAVHDGTSLASSTKTVSEWNFTTSGSVDDYSLRLEPMLQAVYDIEPDAAGTVGAGRRKGAPVQLGLEIGHIAGAADSAAVTGTTLEMRVAGGDWVAVPLEVVSGDSGPGEPPSWIFPEGRAFVTAYQADLPVADAGGWIDFRVTAEDAAGNTFSQEIERAVEVASVKRGGN
ncbi:S8 family peptidase [Agromyces sp. NPDC004153]